MRPKTAHCPKTYCRKDYGTLAALLALAALLWLPAPVQAQIGLTLSPTPMAGLPGDTGLELVGSLTNLANTPADFQSESFNLVSGPAGADLTSAIVFSDSNVFAPQMPMTLTANQIYPGPDSLNFAPLLFLDTDPAAPLGSYTGNFTVTYGAHTVGQDFTINLGVPVPEAGTLPILALGVVYLAFAVRRRVR